jgi:CHAD domain-containing protein
VSERIAVPAAVSVREAAHLVIARQVRELRRQERPVAKAAASERVHDMRVATRRLRAAQAVFRGVVVLPKAGRRGRLRWLARRLGRVRDLDVRMALLTRHHLPHVAGDEAVRLAQLLADLGKERRRQQRRLQRGLERKRYRRLRTALAAWARKPGFAQGAGEGGAARFMAESADRAAQRVSGHEAMRESHPSPEALHDLRIAVKWLRYTLDFHGETCGLAYDTERALARDLQDCLGDLRDHDLLVAMLTGDGAGAWRQLTARVTTGRHRLWRRFLELRRRWHARTRPTQTVAPLEEPRFVNLEVTPVQLRLVTDQRQARGAISHQPSAIRKRRVV